MAQDSPSLLGIARSCDRPLGHLGRHTQSFL